MHIKLVYLFGSLFIIQLIVSFLIFTLIQRNQNFFVIYIFSYLISITFFFRLEVKKALIAGFLGSIESVPYLMYDFVIIYVEPMDPYLINFMFRLIIRIIMTICSISIQIYALYKILKPPKKEIDNIEKSVIEMSKKYTMTTIKEISEKSRSDHDVVSKVLAKMIEESQINADFFRRSKKVAFYREG